MLKFRLIYTVVCVVETAIYRNKNKEPYTPSTLSLSSASFPLNVALQTQWTSSLASVV